MTRLFTEGGEFGDMLAWDVATGQVQSSVKRSGNYAFYNISAGDNKIFQKYFTPSDEIFLRCGIYVTDFSGGYVLALQNDSTILGYIGGVSGQFFKIYLGAPSGTLLATSNIILAINTWYLVEWHLKLSDSVGVSEVKIDGVLVASYSGDTKPGGATTINNFYMKSGSGWASTYIDDIAINDVDNSDGKGDNSWPGDGHIELLKPNGNSPDGGWTDDFVGSDSNSTDNYALVDDVPPSAADYVQSETVGDQDRYAFTDWVGTGKRIKRVWTEARALDASSSGSKLKLGLRVSNADYLSAGKALPGTYGRILGDDYVLNPATAAQWSDSELNDSQLLMEVAE